RHSSVHVGAGGAACNGHGLCESISPARAVIWARSITRGPPPAWGCTWARGPTALMRSPAIRMPTLLRATSERPSIRRPALTRMGWEGGGVWAASEVRTRATISGNAWRIARLLMVARGESLPERVPVKALNLEREVPMATTVTPPERKVSADEAREVAEAAREQEWAAPSFV